MIGGKKPLDDYLSKYHQDNTMLWIWRIIMAMTLFNMVMALFARRWHDALTEFIIAAFILRITTLERYISDCNDKRDQLAKELKDKKWLTVLIRLKLVIA